MSLFLLITLFKYLTDSPSSFLLSTKKYFESSSSWSERQPVTIITRLVLQSTSVGCFMGSLQPSLQDLRFSGEKKLRRHSLSSIFYATCRLRVVQRKSFTFGLSESDCRTLFMFFTEVLALQKTPIPSISFNFQKASWKFLDSSQTREYPCLFLSEMSTRSLSISKATMIWAELA